MRFTEFQKTIIQLIAERKITNMPTFLIEVCRLKLKTEADLNGCIKMIQENIVNCESTQLSPFVLLPYSAGEVLGILLEFQSLLHTLEICNLLTTRVPPIPESLNRLELRIEVQKEEREKGIVEIFFRDRDDATILLRENVTLLIIPHYSELNAFIKRSYITAEEQELQNERWHRRAQFWIALSVALLTSIFGIISAWQNFNKDDNKKTAIKSHIIDTLSNKTDSVNNRNTTNKLNTSIPGYK